MRGADEIDATLGSMAEVRITVGQQQSATASRCTKSMTETRAIYDQTYAKVEPASRRTDQLLIDSIPPTATAIPGRPSSARCGAGNQFRASELLDMQTTQEPNQAIRQLVDLVNETCVRSNVARSQEMVDRWMADHVAYLTEGKAVSTLGETAYPLVEAALDEWSAKFQLLLSVFDGSETNFVCWFVNLRNSAKQTGTLQLRDPWESDLALLYRTSELARQMVWNIG